MQLDFEIFNVFIDIDFNEDAHIAQAGSLQFVLSRLDIVESEFSFNISARPQVVGSDSDNSSDDRIA